MADQTQVAEPPAQNKPDPLSALDHLDDLENPFLSGNDVVEPKQSADAPEPDQESQESEEREVNSALRDVFGINDDGDDFDKQAPKQAPDSDPDPSTPPTRETNKSIRTQLRDRNKTIEEQQQLLAERENRLKELEEQFKETEKERDQYVSAVTSRYDVTEYDENSDPVVQEIGAKMRRTLQEAKADLPGDQAALLEANMVHFVGAYQRSLPSGDFSSLRATIEEHFPGGEREAMAAIKALNRDIEQRTEAIAANRSKHYETVIGGFEKKLEEARAKVAAVGSLSMEEALKNPTNLNSIVSVAMTHDEQYKADVARIQKNCAALVTGVRPFDIRDARWKPYVDPDNPTQLTKEGQRLRQQEVHQHETNQRDLPQTLAMMCAAAALVPGMAAKLAKYESRVKDEQLEPDLRISDDAPPSLPAFDINNLPDDPNDIRNPFT